MKLTIGGKEYELKFGLKFINAMDNLYTQSMSGIKFGMGIEMMSMYLNMSNPAVLMNIIKAGTSHLNSKPSNEDIESYLEEKAEKGELEKLFNEFITATEQAPFLKKQMKQMSKMKKAEA